MHGKTNIAADIPAGVQIGADDPITAEMADAAANDIKTLHDAFNPVLRRVKRQSLSEFKRDTEQRNVLIDGRWGVRGAISMHVSTTGTGKSVLQTQSALCFNRGIECCGLRPVRPFRSWVIQSEDDDDRVALDRDDVAAHLAEAYPEQDWNAAIDETRFLDFTGITGAAFIETLNNELFDDPPDAVIINPFNAYFGGTLKDGADCSAFFKGGEIRRKETEGLEAVLKRHGVWGWIFSHTGKPPTTRELKDWLNDPFSAYKMCGASEIADAVRSIITFLKCPGNDGVFTFTAGKNGNGLRWTDADGNRCTRALWQWGENDRHYWRGVGKDAWKEIWETAKRATATDAGKPPPPPPRDETPIAREVFAGFKTPVTKSAAIDAVRDAVNRDRMQTNPNGRQLGRDTARALIDQLAARGIIRILPQGTNGVNGAMCGLPAVIDAYLIPTAPDTQPERGAAVVPGIDAEDGVPVFGRARFSKTHGGSRQ